MPAPIERASAGMASVGPLLLIVFTFRISEDGTLQAPWSATLTTRGACRWVAVPDPLLGPQT